MNRDVNSELNREDEYAEQKNFIVRKGDAHAVVQYTGGHQNESSSWFGWDSVIVEGVIEAKSVTQLAAYKAGALLARTEGVIPAPETNNALACVVDEALKAKEEGKEKVILFNCSGHGLIDLGAYDRYFGGELKDIELGEDAISEACHASDGYPKPEMLKSF